MNIHKLADNIRIVLSHTSHPGNIGSSARAMKTMCLRSLYLINPKNFPSDSAYMMAAGADDILSNATVYDNLSQAIAPCRLVIGASARTRSLEWPQLTPRECAKLIVEESNSYEVALLFGCETFGLTNEELQACDYHVNIPTNPDYCSLNLAQAVQVLCYEIFQASMAEESLQMATSEVATSENLTHYFNRLENILRQIEFISDAHPNRIMPRLKRLYHRARVSEVELNILQGILTEFNKQVDKNV